MIFQRSRFSVINSKEVSSLKRQIKKEKGPNYIRSRPRSRKNKSGRISIPNENNNVIKLSRLFTLKNVLRPIYKHILAVFCGTIRINNNLVPFILILQCCPIKNQKSHFMRP